MNRIILIGNGFDLAHGLKTSYKDFIDWFWESRATKIKKGRGRKYEDDFIEIWGGLGIWYHQQGNTDYQDLQYNLKQTELKITYKNKFLRTISRKLSLNNWVDIEDEYYKCLVEYSRDNDINGVKKLNSEFADIKRLLNTYLREISEHKVKIKDEIADKIYSKIKLRDLRTKGVESFVDEKVFEHNSSQQILDSDRTKFYLVYPTEICNFPNWEQTYDINTRSSRLPLFEKEKELRDKIRDVLSDTYQLKNIFLAYPKKTLFLNFNYTNIDQLYMNIQRPNLYSAGGDWSANYGITKESIHIHGELDNPNNPMIFGYGDELGDEYMIIEKLNDNNYLENVKSIMYSETDNYKRLLEFVNSDTYQIFIFGHSCGISDRTLLSRLFEHENCISIKPFYHKRKDGSDNYNSELIRNISRNFTDKRLMREKVVNRTYSEPLISLCNKEEN
jgi:hypothetical protein